MCEAIRIKLISAYQLVYLSNLWERISRGGMCQLVHFEMHTSSFALTISISSSQKWIHCVVAAAVGFSTVINKNVMQFFGWPALVTWCLYIIYFFRTVRNVFFVRTSYCSFHVHERVWENSYVKMANVSFFWIILIYDFRGMRVRS